jgi:hypothetical protein
MLLMVLETGKYIKGQPELEIANRIAIAVQGIRFGSVEIIIHEGKVVQIERREKLRFEKRATPETR